MNFKHAVKLLGFLLLLAVGCPISVTAQTTDSATSQTNRLKDKQPVASSLNPSSAVTESSKIDPNVSVRDPKNARDDIDPKTDMSTKSNSIPPGVSAHQWHFQFTPYLWIAGVRGRGGIGALSVNVNSGLGDENVHLNFGFMGTFEARRNKLSIVTDLQYSNLGTERPTPGILFSNASTDFKTFILDSEVGYRVAANSEKADS